MCEYDDYGKRNEDLYQDYLEGGTYGSLAEKYGITRERVRQIILKKRMLDNANSALVQQAENILSQAKYLLLQTIETMGSIESIGSRSRTVTLDSVKMSLRLYNGLKSRGISTLNEAALFSCSDLLRTPNVGRKAFNELNELLASNGFERIK